MEKNYPDKVLLIPIAPPSIYPGIIAPIMINKALYHPEMEQYLEKDTYVGINLLLPEGQNQVFERGVLCKVLKKIKLEDNSINILVQGIKRYELKETISEDQLTFASYTLLEEKEDKNVKTTALVRNILDHIKKIAEQSPFFNEDLKLAVINTPSASYLTDLVAFALNLDLEHSQDFIGTTNVRTRLKKLLILLKKEEEVLKIQQKISEDVTSKLNKQQKEYFLREQLKVIQGELGQDEEKLNDFKKALETIGPVNEDVEKVLKEEFEKLKNLSEQSPEYQVSKNYVQWILSLPWNQSSPSHDFNLKKAHEILDRDHFGLKKVKERILEFLAVKKLKPDYDSTILCFVGPPGVGKTSLGQSIAEALSKKFFRFSLGGMRDEAEIKGHRRTYIGAMPGKILQALKRVEVNNPLIMLDEIDKLSYSYQGDPASALLEVLDPEQNKNFLDHYLDLSFDLSKVMFIATANSLSEIPEPLLDRMEVIELPGYTLEEKLEIAKKFILPKQLKKHGLKNQDLILTKPLLKTLIDFYAREAGIRSLEQIIARLCRKVALNQFSEKSKNLVKELTINPEQVLGPKRFTTEKTLEKLPPGIATGLAWTGYGGDILYVETIPLEGKGFKLTGQLGEVMNESATLAYSYVKKLLQAKKKKKSKEKDYLSSHEVHVHLPAGAIPKDGPSAGITLATALYSLATNQSVRKKVAMTGELSLTGRVLPVGGIKEKVLAAKRAGIKEIILPFLNEKDLKDIPPEHTKGLTFKTVKHFDEVLTYSLVKKK